MRFFISTILGCFICSMSLAGDFDKVIAKVTDASLTETKSIAISSKIDAGYLERIDIGFGNITSSVDAAVSASNILTGVNTTLLTLYSVSNNAHYTPRFNAQTTLGAVGFTNDAQRFILFNEVIYLTVTNALYSNQTVTATAIYEHK